VKKFFFCEKPIQTKLFVNGESKYTVFCSYECLITFNEKVDLELRKEKINKLLKNEKG
jgi:hypothetical protein